MSVAAGDQPQDLPCGVIDQNWLDELNRVRTLYFQCLIEQQANISGLQTDLTQLNNDLPTIICNEIASRVFTDTRSGTGSLSITLPAGGTWQVFAFGIGNEDNTSGSNTVSGGLNTLQWDDGDDNLAVTASGAFAGGTVLSPSASLVRGVFSVFAIRTDCL